MTARPQAQSLTNDHGRELPPNSVYRFYMGNFYCFSEQFTNKKIFHVLEEISATSHKRHVHTVAEVAYEEIKRKGQPIDAMTWYTAKRNFYAR